LWRANVEGAGPRLLLKPEDRGDAFLVRRSAAHLKRHSSGGSRFSHCWPQVLERPPLTLVGLYSHLPILTAPLSAPCSEPVTAGLQVHATPVPLPVKGASGAIMASTEPAGTAFAANHLLDTLLCICAGRPPQAPSEPRPCSRWAWRQRARPAVVVGVLAQHCARAPGRASLIPSSAGPE
jgi:hypothetical protein